MFQLDNVILSVVVGKNMIDMELPAYIAISELKVKLEETIKAIYSGQMDNVLLDGIYFENQRLWDECTLASYGIWDGYTIVCKFVPISKNKGSL